MNHKSPVLHDQSPTGWPVY